MAWYGQRRLRVSLAARFFLKASVAAANSLYYRWECKSTNTTNHIFMQLLSVIAANVVTRTDIIGRAKPYTPITALTLYFSTTN